MWEKPWPLHRLQEVVTQKKKKKVNRLSSVNSVGMLFQNADSLALIQVSNSNFGIKVKKSASKKC